MLSTLQLGSEWLDAWGSYQAAAVDRLGDGVELAGCFMPRFAIVPGQGSQVIPAAGRIRYPFRLEPGSQIVALYTYATATQYQLTELFGGGESHKLFQDPLSGAQLVTTGGSDASASGFTMLPCSWLVRGADGMFELEAWGTPGDTAFLVLQIAELPPCEVLQQ